MDNTYKVEVRQEGVRLDELLFVQLGSVEKLEEVLELNPHILGDVHLQQGVSITLPISEVAVQTQEVKEVESKDLW